MTLPIKIRRALPADAASLTAIWEAIVNEKSYSAVDRPFSIESEREYLQSMSSREALFLAETSEQQVIGFQSLEQWTKLFHSMDHVGQLGTFVLAFARSVRYEKLVIFVRARNTGAQMFYERLGFVPCGRLCRQVKISDEYDDEIMMEMVL